MAIGCGVAKGVWPFNSSAAARLELKSIPCGGNIVVGYEREARHELLANAEDGIYRAWTRYSLDTQMSPLRELLGDQHAHRTGRNVQLAGVHLHDRSTCHSSPTTDLRDVMSTAPIHC
jgi:hypothetical protein